MILNKEISNHAVRLLGLAVLKVTPVAPVYCVWTEDAPSKLNVYVKNQFTCFIARSRSKVNSNEAFV